MHKLNPTATAQTFSHQYDIPGKPMPTPSMRGAPHFDGKNLHRFLIDFENASEEAGWSNKRRCAKLPGYCKHPIQEYIETFVEVTHTGDWDSLKEQLYKHYQPNKHKPRYSEHDLERFVRQKRTIDNQDQLAKYYRNFRIRKAFLRPRENISTSKLNRYFWQGLPRTLKKDVYEDLKTKNPRLDRYEAQDMEVVHDSARSILDKDAIYASISHTRGIDSDYEDIPTPTTRREKRKPEKRRRKHEDLYADVSDSSDLESELSGTDTEHLSVSPSDSESESESEEKSARKKFQRSRLRPKTSRHRLDPERAPKAHRHDKKKPHEETESLDDQRVRDLTEELRRLTLKVQAKDQEFSMSRRLPDHKDSRETDRTYSSHDQRFNELTQEVRNLRMQLDSPRNSPQMAPNRSSFNPNRNPQTNIRCWFCKQTGRHPPRLNACPEVRQLLKEDILVEDNKGTITMTDGSRIPSKTSDPSETMEQFIRRIHMPNRRDSPPHQRAANQMLYEPSRDNYWTTDSLRLIEPWDEEPYNPEVAQLSNNDDWDAMDVDRSEKRNTRFEPYANADPRKTRSPQNRPYVEVPPLARSTPPKSKDNVTHLPKPSADVPIQRLPPRVPVNPPSILKRSPPTPTRMNNVPNEDIEMMDLPDETSKGPERLHPPRAPAKLEFTSEAKQDFNSDKFFEGVLRQPLTVTLGELLGASGEVSRRCFQYTKTRKEPITKMKTSVVNRNSQSFWSYPDPDDSLSEEEEICSTTSDYRPTYHNRAVSHGPHLLNPSLEGRVFSVNQLAREIDKNLYAAGTGKLEITVGQTEGIRAMVDTGSELNMMSRSLQEQLGIPIDPAGSAWAVRGINGQPENLFGCCRKVPIELGGLRFDHIFFVKDGEVSGDYQVLLGQPWLHAAAADIKYEVDEQGDRFINMRLYNRGDRNKGSIIVRLDVDKRREATKLVFNTRTKSPKRRTISPEFSEDENNPQDHRGSHNHNNYLIERSAQSTQASTDDYMELDDEYDQPNSFDDLPFAYKDEESYSTWDSAINEAIQPNNNSLHTIQQTDLSRDQSDFIQLNTDYQRFGSRPSINAVEGREPTIPTLGRRMAEAL